MVIKLTGRTAFSRDVPDQYAENGVYFAYVHVVVRTHVHASNDDHDQVDRTRPEPAKQGGKHAHARSRLADQDLHRSGP